MKSLQEVFEILDVARIAYETGKYPDEIPVFYVQDAFWQLINEFFKLKLRVSELESHLDDIYVRFDDLYERFDSQNNCPVMQ
jgi:hypothetical protein